MNISRFQNCLGLSAIHRFLLFCLKYKLKKQDLVIFPGGFTHPHSVEKITDGNRIALNGQSMGTRHKHKLGQAINFL